MKVNLNAVVLSLFAIVNLNLTTVKANNFDKIESLFNKEMTDVSVLRNRSDVKAEEKRDLDKLFKIELKANQVVVSALVPFEKIKDPIYINVLSSRSEIIIHQLITSGETTIDLKDFKKGEYFVEVSRDDEKIVKHISWK